MRNGPPGPRREGWRDRPHPSRLDPERPDAPEIIRRHAHACASGLSSYLDPATGYSVMTADYLASRDACCGQGCRHCPWEGATASPEREGDG